MSQTGSPMCPSNGNAVPRPTLRQHLALIPVALLALLLGCTATSGRLPSGDDDDSSGDDDDSSGDDDSAPDSDGDGWSDNEDCWPNNALAHPGAAEICDGIDSDCDGALGNGENGTPDELDLDGDGITVCAGDCDDQEASTFPGEPESCDGTDSNCNGFPENTPSGDPQEMFILSWGHLYVTILSVDADCDIHLTMDAPVVIPDMVGEVHTQLGTEVDVGQVTPCTAMRFTSTSCSTQFSTLDPAAFQVSSLGTNHWLLEHEDGADNDYNDVIFEALVEARE